MQIFLEVDTNKSSYCNMTVAHIFKIIYNNNEMPTKIMSF